MSDDDLGFVATRIRLGIVVWAAVLLTFAIVDLFIASPAYVWLQLLKGGLLLAGVWLWWLTGRTRSRSTLYLAVIAVDTFTVLVISVSSTLVGQDWHPAALAGSLAIATAALVPWGVRLQIALSAAVTVAAIVPPLLVWDGTRTLFLVASLSPVACSILVAWQNERYRRSARGSFESFRENFERLNQLTEHIHGVFWLSELGGVLLYVSPRFEEIWGRRRSVLDGRPEAWLDSVHPDDRAEVHAWLRDESDVCEYRIIRPDGSWRWVRDRRFPIAGAQGGPWRVARLSLDVTAEREAARARRMQELARGIQGALEEERKRMARELHDELGQTLTGIKLLLAGVEGSGQRPGTGAATVPMCIHEIERVMQSVHAMIHTLRPPVLDELGLVAALRSQADAFVRHTGIPCDVDLPEAEPSLSAEEVTTVFRIAQESLTNVARHAQATSVAMRFVASGDRLQLSVEDDGTGMAAAHEDFGVRGMRERADLLNGSLAIESGSHGGTCVRLDLPRGQPQRDVLATLLPERAR